MPETKDDIQLEALEKLQKWTKRVQEAHNWTLTDWAKAAGLSRPVISGIANGNRPIQLSSLVRAAAVTAVPLPVLVEPMAAPPIIPLIRIAGTLYVGTKTFVDDEPPHETFAVRAPEPIVIGDEVVETGKLVYLTPGPVRPGMPCMVRFPCEPPGVQRVEFLATKSEVDFEGNIGVHRVSFLGD